MPHQHGKEYRIKLHKPDGSVDYSLWFNTYDELCREMANVSPLQGGRYFVQERNYVCAECADADRHLEEYPYPISTR